MKKLDKILEFLRIKGYPAFSTSEYRDIPTAIRRQVEAVIGSLTHDDLIDLVTTLEEDPEAPYYLIDEVRWYISRTPEAKAKHHTESVKQLLGWYTDKQSKRVSYAAKQLKDLFPLQSPAVQKTILKTFLHGGKKEAEWAGRKLRNHWNPAFERDVLEKWRETRLAILASVILRHFSDSIIVQEQEDLAQDIGYATICVRLGNLKGFTIDENRLGAADWFYVMGKLGREDVVSKIDGRLRECILSLEPLDIPCSGDSDVFDIRPLGLAIWAMKKLHHTEGILRLLDIWEHAIRYSTAEDDEFRHYSLLFSMQCQAENLEEEDPSLNTINSFIDL